jgi:hypothetical protein
MVRALSVLMLAVLLAAVSEIPGRNWQVQVGKGATGRSSSVILAAYAR